MVHTKLKISHPIEILLNDSHTSNKVIQQNNILCNECQNKYVKNYFLISLDPLNFSSPSQLSQKIQLSLKKYLPQAINLNKVQGRENFTNRTRGFERGFEFVA